MLEFARRKVTKGQRSANPASFLPEWENLLSALSKPVQAAVKRTIPSGCDPPSQNGQVFGGEQKRNGSRLGKSQFS
jgi:hypothetical protein